MLIEQPRRSRRLMTRPTETERQAAASEAIVIGCVAGRDRLLRRDLRCRPLGLEPAGRAAGIGRAWLAQDARVTERESSGLRPDAEPVRPTPDRDPREQPPRASRDRVDLAVVAAGQPQHLPVCRDSPISGLPPPGRRHFATTFRRAKLIT